MSAEPALKYSHVILLVCRLYTKNRMPERFCVQAFGDQEPLSETVVFSVKERDAVNVAFIYGNQARADERRCKCLSRCAFETFGEGGSVVDVWLADGKRCEEALMLPHKTVREHENRRAPRLSPLHGRKRLPNIACFQLSYSVFGGRRRWRSPDVAKGTPRTCSRTRLAVRAPANQEPPKEMLCFQRRPRDCTKALLSLFIELREIWEFCEEALVRSVEAADIICTWAGNFCLPPVYQKAVSGNVLTLT
ncbi:hypothetical protein EAH_00034360 [Eimeria acervulina]|uniref:Uncharacterized protein n=1 Tax=Eimeria acervulina TaxID=5801 RepID=U6GV99_EIMAC|nr:hypothetical protein EAH_00034360 [Eimeria acervulina]CDI83213.1 hypothetical protein EAH_00034360 [Eimeria acervulina]